MAGAGDELRGFVGVAETDFGADFVGFGFGMAMGSVRWDGDRCGRRRCVTRSLHSNGPDGRRLKSDETISISDASPER